MIASGYLANNDVRRTSLKAMMRDTHSEVLHEIALGMVVDQRMQGGLIPS
jgi:hypothetical protein